MSKPTTPPAAWDRHALEVARGIASIDRSKLPGLTTQFVAILQSAIVESMMMAAKLDPVSAIRCTNSQRSMCAPSEQGSLVERQAQPCRANSISIAQPSARS